MNDLSVMTLPAVGAGYVDPRFASIEQLTEEERQSNRTRQFVGDGRPFLAVPGILSVERIRIGNMDLPLSEDREYPVNNAMKTETVTEPLVAFSRLPDNTPVLIRAKISNDGIWPKDANIFITGDWEEPAEDAGDEDSSEAANAGAENTAPRSNRSKAKGNAKANAGEADGAGAGGAGDNE